jgi:hypothetical protein
VTVLASISRATDVAITADVIPTGLIMCFPVDAAPHDGWLPCDGRVVYYQNAPDGKNYNALFTAIGHAFNGGASPAVDRFRLPGLMPNTATINGVAANGASRTPTGPSGDTVGATTGVLNHTHTANTLTMPNHGHGVGSYAFNDHGHGNTLSAPNHGHSITQQDAPIGGGTSLTIACLNVTSIQNAQPGVGGSVSNSGALGATGSLTGGGATAVGGATQATPSLPYVGVAWMVKT